MPDSNLDVARSELAALALTSPRAAELLRALRGARFERERARARQERDEARGGEGGHVPWARFKARVHSAGDALPES